MRISDWSSDVCSSDLPVAFDRRRQMVGETREEVLVVTLEGARLRTVDCEDSIIMAFHPDQHVDGAADIELPQERRPAEPFLDDKANGSETCRERGCPEG